MALPKDELELISKKLTFDPDYIRFRSVCKSWRSAAPKRPQLPWLISYTRIFDRNSFSASFYQFSFETNKITRVAEFLGSPFLSSFVDNSTYCLGPSRGWLALINRKTSSVLLFNPLTNSSIDLPNRSENVFLSSCSCFYLTSDPRESLSNCFAVIYDSCGISYCKVGSNAWIELALDPCIYITHFCSYHGKHLFASSGDVFVCEFGPNSSVCQIISVSLDDEDTFASEIEFMCSWLVESGEDLLFVLVYYIANFDSCYYRVLKLEVECHLPKSVELRNLGNKALFLSRKIAFSVTSGKYPGCYESCIYTASTTSENGCPVQMVEVSNFGGLPKSMCIKNDLAPSPVYGSDWFSPSLLM